MRNRDKLNRICKCGPITEALAPLVHLTRCNLQPTFRVLMLSRVWFHLISEARMRAHSGPRIMGLKISRYVR